MSFVPENELEQALMRASKEPSARAEFYQLLLASDLFVIGKTKNRTSPGKVHLSTGENIEIASGEANGKSFLPVFSSLSRLQTYSHDQQSFIALNGRALFELTRGAFMILNPASDYGKELLPEEIARLLDPDANQPKQITVEKQTQVLLGQPSVYPHPLVDALKVGFGGDSAVAAAYLLQIAFSDATQPPHPLIGIETTGDWNSLAARIGPIAAAAAPGILFDLVRIDRGRPDTLSGALLKTQPFYQRKKSFLRAIFN